MKQPRYVTLCVPVPTGFDGGHAFRALREQDEDHSGGTGLDGEYRPFSALDNTPQTVLVRCGNLHAGRLRKALGSYLESSAARTRPAGDYL